MNTANKLTLLRVVMIPAFLLVLYLDVPGASYWALAIFVAASLTDTLDGYIARHYNQVTDFGKFMDPLADKCLVVAAMLWFVEIGQMPAWAVLIAGVCRVRTADGGRRQGAGHRRRLVGEGEDCLYHGVHRAHAHPPRGSGDQLPVRGGHRADHHLLRGGVFHQESGCAVRNKMSAFSIIACIQIREPRLSQTDGAFLPDPLKEREFENEALRSQSIRARGNTPPHRSGRKRKTAPQAGNAGHNS